MPPPIRILKIFKKISDFLQERNAFHTLLESIDHIDHIIGFLGSYEQDGLGHIILEYADLGCLDDFFRKIPPPASEEDIITFFTSFFQLVNGLISIHEVTETLVG
jgi:serine/threonine protein kinase